MPQIIASANDSRMFVRSNLQLKHNVVDAMRHANLDQKYQGQAYQAAWYLDSTGWAERIRGETELCVGDGGEWNLKQARKSAIKELQTVGIIPSGIAWWLVKSFLLPYLIRLIWNLLMEEES